MLTQAQISSRAFRLSGDFLPTNVSITDVLVVICAVVETKRG
jgi:hypothetical protein